jgi:hypothetical protein
MSYKIIFLIFGISFLFILTMGSIVFSFLLPWPSNQESETLAQSTLSAAIATQVAQTVIAEITQRATESTLTPFSTPEPPLTDVPTATPSPESTKLTNTPFLPTDIVPTLTFVPLTMIVPTFTPKSVVCDSAQFVRDVSVEDNSPFAPGATFVKTWRLKNVGSCTWDQDYDLVFVSGDAMDAKLAIPLPKKVEPNQTIDISVTMKAPNKAGTYRGDWMLSNASGTRFGIGPKGNQSVWVQIRVMNLENTNLVYDFAANYCKAEWSSSAGRLPCPGHSSATEGYVILLDTPHLENRLEDEWTLIAHPSNHSRGWISGIYPEFVIQPNHHFTAWVGCLSDSKGCNLNFRLDFKNLKTGSTKNLGAWHEVYDGEVTKIDLDLSEHVGKKVRFILTVEVNGGNPPMANAFWFVPGIVLKTTPTATPTLLLPTETPTPTETSLPSETPTDIPTETLVLTETPGQ